VHTPMRGAMQRGPGGAVLTPHWWIDLADGKRIDFRARQGLDHESGIPSGIFDPAAWPGAAYQGAPVTDSPPVDATRGALDLDWLTLSAAVRPLSRDLEVRRRRDDRTPHSIRLTIEHYV